MNFNRNIQLIRKISKNKPTTIIYNQLSTVADTKSSDDKRNFVGKRKMKGWQIHSYGNLEEVIQFSEKVKIPTIKCPNDVLIRVKSTAVNPIDVALIKGYGATLLNTMRCNEDNIEFPLTLGREFSGVVVQKGLAEADIKVGDEVWGVVPVHLQGCHAEYVVVPASCVSQKPSGLSNIEAGSTLYAGLTAWSGLFLSGMLGGLEGALTPRGGGRGKKALVVGAAGGVGSIAIQILKAEGAAVIATCSEDAIPLVQGLGADYVIDYTRIEQENDYAALGPYDIILDCAGQGPSLAQRYGWNFKNFVTFSSPLLRNIDENGLALGMLKNIRDAVERNVLSLARDQGCIKWGYFVPSQNGIQYLKRLVERKKLLPAIDSTYDFKNIRDAYEKTENGHLRGKVTISLENC